MASAVWHDRPAYTLAALPPRSRHVVLTPAIRWRVIVEEVIEITHDVMLDAVLRIRAAGETSPTSVADLLQIPEDLVRHLLFQAAATRMQVTHDGRVEAGTSTVSWIYRDLETGELWPHPAKEVPPIALRFTSRNRARFDRGTAGRPIPVECLLMDTEHAMAADPTSVELARFSRASADPNRRTALVSAGEPCMIASPVVALTSGHAVWTTRGVPHLTLSQRLTELGRQRESVRRWLATVPKSAAAPQSDLPLRQAMAELREVAAERKSSHQTVDDLTVLSRIELCLSRFVDQVCYAAGISSTGVLEAAAASAGERAGLSRDLARRWARSDPGTAGHKVLRLLAVTPGIDQSVLSELVACASDFTAIAPESVLAPALESLVNRTLDLCDRLVTTSEGTDVQQAG
jgi:hypothetical protein